MRRFVAHPELRSVMAGYCLYLDYEAIAPPTVAVPFLSYGLIYSIPYTLYLSLNTSQPPLPNSRPRSQSIDSREGLSQQLREKQKDSGEREYEREERKLGNAILTHPKWQVCLLAFVHPLYIPHANTRLYVS